MKTLSLVAVAILLTLCGCMTTSTLTNGVDGNTHISPEKKITVVLNDDTEIDVEPYRHIIIPDSSDIVYGYGKLSNPQSNIESTFTGSVNPVRVVPGRASVYAGWGQSKHVPCSDFILADSSSVRFLEGDFVTVIRSGGAGLWCAGTKTVSGTPILFKGRIPFTDIASVGERKVSTGKTLLFVGAVAGSVAVIAVAAIASGLGKMNFGGLAPGLGR